MNTFLTDLIPARYRKYAYALMTLLAAGYAAWQASDGDWNQVIASVVVVLIGATATSNTDVRPKPVALGDLVTAVVDANMNLVTGVKKDGTVVGPSALSMLDTQTIKDSFGDSFGDGCRNEHNPSTNPNCTMAPIKDSTVAPYYSEGLTDEGSP